MDRVSELIQSLYSEWKGKGMIADMIGVPHVKIATSTIVPVQLYNDRDNAVTINEAPRVEVTSNHVLSMLGVLKTPYGAPQVERPSNHMISMQGAMKPSMAPAFQDGVVSTLMGQDRPGRTMPEEGLGFKDFDGLDVDGNFLGIDGKLHGSPGTVKSGGSNTTLSSDSRGKAYESVCSSAKRDQKGKQVIVKIMSVKGKKGNKEAKLKYKDGSFKWVTFTALPEEHCE